MIEQTAKQYCEEQLPYLKNLTHFTWRFKDEDWEQLKKELQVVNIPKLVYLPSVWTKDDSCTSKSTYETCTWVANEDGTVTRTNYKKVEY